MTNIELETLNAVKTACRRYLDENKSIDWEQRRYEIARDLFVANRLRSTSNVLLYCHAELAVRDASMLIEELKKQQNG